MTAINTIAKRHNAEKITNTVGIWKIEEKRNSSEWWNRAIDVYLDTHQEIFSPNWTDMSALLKRKRKNVSYSNCASQVRPFELQVNESDNGQQNFQFFNYSRDVEKCIYVEKYCSVKKYCHHSLQCKSKTTLCKQPGDKKRATDEARKSASETHTTHELFERKNNLNNSVVKFFFGSFFRIYTGQSPKDENTYNQQNSRDWSEILNVQVRANFW